MYVYCVTKLGLDVEKVNVNGGAIALGRAYSILRSHLRELGSDAVMMACRPAWVYRRETDCHRLVRREGPWRQGPLYFHVSLSASMLSSPFR